jgi:hypothetical protein
MSSKRIEILKQASNHLKKTSNHFKKPQITFKKPSNFLKVSFKASHSQKRVRGNCRIATTASLPRTVSPADPEIKKSGNRNSKKKTNCFIKQKRNSRDRTSGLKDHQSPMKCVHRIWLLILGRSFCNNECNIL